MPRGFDDIKISRRHTAYVVFEGFEPGVYTTWEAAEVQVKGYRKNKYKGFPCVEKAKRAYKRYLKEKKRSSNSNPKAKLIAGNQKSKKVEPTIRNIALDNDIPPWDID